MATHAPDFSPTELTPPGAVAQADDVDHRPNWDDPEAPTAGYVGWLLWGGDEGRAWITRLDDKLPGARG